MRWMTLTAPLIAATALALAGCADTAAPAAAPPPEPFAPLAFGQTHTWPNGDTVTVAAPREVTGKAYDPADGGYSAKDFVVFDITVTNNGTQPSNAPSMGPAAVLVDGVQAPFAYDAVDAVPGMRNTAGSLLPGQSRTFSAVYEPVPGGREVQLDMPSGALADSGTVMAVFVGAWPHETTNRLNDDSGVSTPPEVDPDLNVGPDGYCTATPCGTNGKVPEVDGRPYSP